MLDDCGAAKTKNDELTHCRLTSCKLDVATANKPTGPQTCDYGARMEYNLDNPELAVWGWRMYWRMWGGKADTRTPVGSSSVGVSPLKSPPSESILLVTSALGFPGTRGPMWQTFPHQSPRYCLRRFVLFPAEFPDCWLRLKHSRERTGRWRAQTGVLDSWPRGVADVT